MSVVAEAASAAAVDRAGIATVDTGFQRPGFDASHLIVENGRGAFVDCGTTYSVPNLLAALQDNALAPHDVDWLILTHVHLDHAGGAGALMRALPNARMAVHPRGAPHMIDPSKLIAGATAVWGAEAMARDYGEIVPVPAERVRVVEDGDTLQLAGRALQFVDTPGHARHHHCIWDERSGAWFTGDTLGLSYRDFDSARGAFVLPTTSPSQFEPEPLKDSIRRLLQRKPRAAYLTHYGRVDEVERLAADMIEQIDAMVAFARRAQAETGDRDARHARLCAALADYYVERLLAHGTPMSEATARAMLADEVEVNAQGLEFWLDRGG
ncbi:MBL fold metallo-hydrolase [Lysobacter enzymogenes]|uniref:MBL fold metallo-hydrolase n=1 Tax=Lysobacter enzymogenes TaxID=69 RepID=UPI001A97528B|nr:MBL fold metallo-hydrolase [Lysobacter enzymogenes]QQP94970.1 MBL fold metallo-hydrolase [Lysobacter enzymogenes]